MKSAMDSAQHVAGVIIIIIAFIIILHQSDHPINFLDDYY